MKFLWKIIVAVVSISLVLIVSSCKPAEEEGVSINGVVVPPVPKLDPQRVSQGEVLYGLHCAECHGDNLEGAANWQTTLPDGSFPPPPHDDSGHTWHHPDDYLIEIITRGSTEVYGGTMPGFGEKLTETEIEMILDYIKSTWDTEAREFQWWISAQ